MDFETIKHLSKRFGGMVIVENNKPAYIVLDYERYLELERQNSEGMATGHKLDHESHQSHNVAASAVSGSISEENPEILESLNREIQALNEEVNRYEQERTREA